MDATCSGYKDLHGTYAGKSCFQTKSLKDIRGPSAKEFDIDDDAINNKRIAISKDNLELGIPI